MADHGKSAPQAARPETTFAVAREIGPGGGRYVASVDGLMSEMTFRWGQRGEQRLMIIDHTGVPKALSGRGVGLALVRQAVEDARLEDFRLAPQCSFVVVTMARRKEWQDVLAAE